VFSFIPLKGVDVPVVEHLGDDDPRKVTDDKLWQL